MTSLFITPPGGLATAVDLPDDISFSLNYAIADVREPDKRQSAFSKTITLPGTANNNKLFAHIYEIDSTGIFNPNRKAAAVVYTDSLPVFSGFMQLTKITSTYNHDISYEVHLLGNLADFFYALQQVNNTTNNPLYLDDLALDGSKGNTATDCSHSKTTQAVAGSWSNTSKYVYPLMDFGAIERHSIPGGHYALNSKNATPCLFAKTILDEIFYEAGTNIGLPAGTYSYKNDFLNGVNLPAGYVNFTKLIVPCINTKPRTVTVTLTIITQTNYAPITNTPYSTYVALHQVFAASGVDSTVNYAYYPGGVGSGGNATYTVSFNVTLNHNDKLYVSMAGNLQAGSTFTVSYVSHDKLGLDGSFSAALTSPFVPAYNVASTVIYDTKIYDNSNTYNITSGLHTAPKINPAGMLARNMRQSDFIMGLVKLFNLYIQVDKSNPNCLVIEPRDSFYGLNGFVPSYDSAPITVDWTNKLDISQPIEQNPMGDLQGKVYRFSYKADNDFWNKMYTAGGNENLNGSTTGRNSSGCNEVYGEYRYNIINDFQTQDYLIETLFSPTLSVSYDIDNNTQYPIVMPTRVNSTPFSTEAESGNYNYYAGNLRLLYYGGLKTCSVKWYLTEDNNASPAYGGKMSSYPYAGHLDDPYAPTLDLNYYMPVEIYFNIMQYPTNGLFNVYWSNYVAQTTDANSKLVTATFRLTPLDMLNLDFRNQIWVDGHYYYLHSIEDYNPADDYLTKVTLLKLNNALNLQIASRTLSTNRPLGRIISGPIAGLKPSGWPGGVSVNAGAVWATGHNNTLQVGYITGSNLRDKVMNGSLWGGGASTISFPFKILSSPNEISAAHIIGSNIN